MKRRKHAAPFFVLLACTRVESAPDAGPPNVVLEAMAPVPPPPPSWEAGAPMLHGTWERKTEPYRGMKIRFEASSQAVVTASPLATMERVAKGAGTKAQLECQQRLWKPGDTFIQFLPSPASSNEEMRTRIVVRDWGLTNGVCRHSDSMADAELVLSGDELAIKVTRGKTVVTQTWARASD